MARELIDADLALSAHCNRVAVEDGHTESVSLKLRKPATAEEIIEAWNEFRCLPQKLRLPTAPEQPIIYEARRTARSLVWTVTRTRHERCLRALRPGNIFDWKFTVLSHNTIRGAAGAAVLTASCLKRRDTGLLEFANTSYA